MTTPSLGGKSAILFYDGRCGLCHRVVRLVVAADRKGDRFVFAPLHGATFAAAIPPERQAGLPDSIVLLGADGSLLVKSSAVRAILAALGGWWGVLELALWPVPAMVLDFLYDRVASVRGGLFASPPDACPVLPPALRARFRD